MKEIVKDWFNAIGVALFTLIGDVAVIYSIFYILSEPKIPWWWIIPVILITGPILYIFNKYVCLGIRDLMKKKK